MSVLHKHTASITSTPSPVRGSTAEAIRFKKIQQRFPKQFEHVFPDKLAPRTVIIIPSLTMDPEILSKISGVNHYEERLLCMLMLLRMPRTNVIYVTSEPIDPVIIDYYLHMLPGITGYHAQRRLTLLNCHDSSLAVQLDLPIYGCDPDLYDLGSKSNGRKLFRECGLSVPAGFEDLHTEEDIVEGLTKMKQNNPALRKGVVKVNDGFSGDGNAIFSYTGSEDAANLKTWIKENLQQRLKMVATDLSYKDFLKKYDSMGGMVEEFLEGDIKQSPSVQCRITPKGHVEIISTHDQELGGESGQIYIGAQFPASSEYVVELGIMGKNVAEALKKKGVLGRFAVEFISVKEKDEWKHYPIEINLRKGGTTHPFLMLQFLTDGIYNDEEGKYYTSKGHLIRYYFCSDNLKSDKYRGLSPHDLIDIAMVNDLHYDGTSQEGVMFHLIGALSQYGKLGVVCIGSTPERAREFYAKIVSVLEKEC